MEQPEEISKLKAIQQKLKETQNALEEVTLSSGGELRVVMDGNMQLTDLQWLHTPDDPEEQKSVLIKTINTAIVSMTMKVQQIVRNFAVNMNLPMS